MGKDRLEVITKNLEIYIFREYKLGKKLIELSLMASTIPITIFFVDSKIIGGLLFSVIAIFVLKILTLKKLTQNELDEVFELIRNTKDEELFNYIVKSIDIVDIKKNIYLNDNFTLDYGKYKDILLNESEEFQYNLFENENCPEYILVLLLENKNFMKNVISNTKKYTSKKINKIINEFDDEINCFMYIIKNNSETPLFILEKIKEYEEYCELAQKSNDLKILEKLSKHNSVSIREFVAKNINTSENILRVLSDDVGRVKYYVAEHINTPLDVLIKLSQDNDKYVREKSINKLNKKS